MSVRVYQLAKDLGMESRDVIDLLRKRGFKVTSASSSIPNIYAEEVLAELKPNEKIELVTTSTDSVADIEESGLSDDEIDNESNNSTHNRKKTLQKDKIKATPNTESEKVDQTTEPNIQTKHKQQSKDGKNNTSLTNNTQSNNNTLNNLDEIADNNFTDHKESSKTNNSTENIKIASVKNNANNKQKPAPVAPKIALPNQQNRAPSVPALNKSVHKRTMPEIKSTQNKVNDTDAIKQSVNVTNSSEANISNNDTVTKNNDFTAPKSYNVNSNTKKAAPSVPSLAHTKPHATYNQNFKNSAELPVNNAVSHSTSNVSYTTSKPAPTPGKFIKFPHQKNNSANLQEAISKYATKQHNHSNIASSSDVLNISGHNNQESDTKNKIPKSNPSPINKNIQTNDNIKNNNSEQIENKSNSADVIFSNERSNFGKPNTKYDRSAPKSAPSTPRLQHNNKDRRAPTVNFNFSKKSFNNPVLSDNSTTEVNDKNLTQLSLRAPIIVKDFAQRIGLKPFQLISELMQLGIFASMNQQISEDVAVKIAKKYGFNLEIKQKIDPKKQAQKEKPVVVKELSPRPPVVCVLGHVDHGKTTLLDTLRHANVASGEAGGITQHVGAYQVESDCKKITFLDTPGHAAFSKMRERGANVTDIAILIVAADDGFMPQTDEALKFAQNAGVPVVVAINKIDAKGANVDRVKQQMQQRGIAPEDWGGDTLCVGISALKGTNVDELLSLVLLQAEMMELKAAYKCPAQGVIVESQIDVGRGSTAVVIIQEGTLKVRDSLVCGKEYCRVKSMLNERGEQVKEATPSTAVRLIGWSGVPETGATFSVVENEKIAKKQAEENELELKKAAVNHPTPKINNFKNLFAAIESQKQKVLKVILKSDVHGSMEALEECLRAIKSEKVKLEILSNDVGAISKVDVEMASSADAVIVGFNVKLDNGVAQIVKNKGVKIIQHNIIYELIDQVRDAMTELLDYEYTENHLGTAEVRKVFNLAKAVIGGSMVVDGVIIRDKQARVLRKKEIVFDGKIESLKRQKDDHSEVRSGFECGIKIPGFTDFQEGDIVECYEMVSHRQTL